MRSSVVTYVVQREKIKKKRKVKLWQQHACKKHKSKSTQTRGFGNNNCSAYISSDLLNILTRIPIKLIPFATTKNKI